MKRKNLFIVIAFLLCFGGGSLFGVYVLCSRINSNHGNQKISPVNPFEKCYSCNSDHCMIPYSDIKTMIHKYKTDRSSLISNVEDSRAIVFDLESLKQYICKVESTVHANGLEGSYDLAGLRFYYTVYPSTPLYDPNAPIGNYMSSIDQLYREKHSLLIMPTYKLGTEYIDFDPQHFYPANTPPHNTTGSPIPMAIDSSLVATSILAYDPLYPCMNASNSMNHGGMCPPTCPQGVTLIDIADQ